MPLRVAICDDERQVCADLEAALRKILAGRGIAHEIDVFRDTEGLRSVMEAGVRYGLIFLDIEFADGEMDGVELGGLIRHAYDRLSTSIVYISWESKYSRALIGNRVLEFLDKPLEYGEIERVTLSHLRLFRIGSEDFVYRTRTETRSVKIADIAYIESANRKLILHLSDGGKRVFYGILKDVYAERLRDADFLHIHASYAVNFCHVKSMARGRVVLSTGATLPISKQKRDDAEDAYFEILERRGAV